MVRAMCLFPGWETPSFADEEGMTEAFQKIRTLYDAGVSLYTKEALRDIDKQLENCVERGRKISIKGIDGIRVDFEIETGRTLRDMNPDLEVELKSPFIFYLAFQHLTSITNNYVSQMAYCSLRLYHPLELRNKITKEMVACPLIRSETEAQEFFAKAQDIWKASKTYQHLTSILSTTEAPFATNKIVAFACSSMSLRDEEDLSRAAAFQHALILTVRAALMSKRQANEDQIACYAQDPIYTGVDRSLLNHYGITVLNDPKGFLEVDESIVVISVGPNVPVKEIVSDITCPAIMIWDRIRDDDNHAHMSSTDPDSPRVKELVRNHYQQLEFPPNDGHFGDLAIYVRQS